MAGRPKGIPKTGGRKKGVPNRTTAELKALLLESLHKVGGMKYLVQLAKDEPKAYSQLIGKLIPRDIQADLTIRHGLIDAIHAARDRTGS